MRRSLTALERPRRLVMRLRWLWFTSFWGMDIHPTALISLKAQLDRTYPKGVHIGAFTYVTLGSLILSHDRTRGLYLDTVIGDNCFLGARSLVLPGVIIGDNSIVAAGAVVTKDVPPRSIVAGNPATVVRSDIHVGHYGRMTGADETTRQLKREGRIRY